MKRCDRVFGVESRSRTSRGREREKKIYFFLTSFESFRRRTRAWTRHDARWDGWMDDEGSIAIDRSIDRPRSGSRPIVLPRRDRTMTVMNAMTDCVLLVSSSFVAHRKPASTFRTLAARAPAPRARVRSRYV